MVHACGVWLWWGCYGSAWFARVFWTRPSLPKLVPVTRLLVSHFVFDFASFLWGSLIRSKKRWVTEITGVARRIRKEWYRWRWTIWRTVRRPTCWSVCSRNTARLATSTFQGTRTSRRAAASRSSATTTTGMPRTPSTPWTAVCWTGASWESSMLAMVDRRRIDAEEVTRAADVEGKRRLALGSGKVQNAESNLRNEKCGIWCGMVG